MAYMKDTGMNVHGFSLDSNGAIVCMPRSPLPLDGEDGVFEWRVTSPDDKGKIIAQLDLMLEGSDEAHDFLRQRAALMVDEMLENALYAAPRDANGKQLFHKGAKRVVLPGECITVRCAFNGERLTLEVSDNWGSLSTETALHFISLNLDYENIESDRAGRGLFFMWHFMDDFYVSVKPGEETAIGGALSLYPHLNETGAGNYGTTIQD